MRKPIDQQQPHECRQAMWDWIRNRSPYKSFTWKDIADGNLSQKTVQDYLRGLENAGYLESTHDIHRNKPVLYRLKKDTGVDAPRVRIDGTIVTMGDGRRQMWNTIQVLKNFTLQDMIFNASTGKHAVAESEAKTYCQYLAKAGYLKSLGHQLYKLVPGMWTGPHPPQIQRTKQVYDPNLKKVVWSRIEAGAE